ncbi:hypothetical protein [Pedobacter xixiisoli]|uniref:Uncharacterized protein n=1 Tax=Pedobacter xixiisoli TaxID=1476464 RepID=A0A286AAJ1_9SPHI|nr:hypothetical protein [Pedobacter xixiisoli]SOD18919.1 hypothetical protein SAMN06297358_3252 [Pedobacter xixiisoli]
MKPKETWATELKNGIFGGLTPMIDPFDKTKFYISDGWGSSYPSMKLRQLSFEDGKELKTASIKNSVRCLYFNPDKRNIFAVTDNKIFLINKIDFSIIKKFEKGIQKYSDYISSNDKDTLLLMNYNADFLFVYNYETEKGLKKKVKTCRGIYKESENTYLLFCPKAGSIQQYDLQTNKLKEILQTAIFYKAHKSKSDKFYLHLGKLIEATSNTHEKIEPLNQIDIYSKSDLTNKSELKFDFHFDQFIVSENEETLYLIHNNKYWVYSLLKQKIEEEIILDEKVRIAQLFDEQKAFISYEYDKPDKITYWKF